MRRLVILALLFGGSAAFAQTDQAFPQQLPNQMRQQQQQVPEELRQLPQQITQSRSCGQVSGQADVTVEDTKDGAILHMKAKDPSQVAQVQHMAQRLQSCMTATQ